jgi:maltose alpha-D-glucosyltransferase/alpha-amylase
MVRSYHYAIVMALHRVAQAGIAEEAYAVLDEWANAIHVWLSASFLRGYLEAVDGSSIIPSDPTHVRLLLDALVVEKAAYELEYEVNNRPDWVEIPLHGILNTLS